MKKRWLTLLVVSATLVFALVSCQPVAPEPAEGMPTEAPPEEMEEEPTATQGEMEGGEEVVVEVVDSSYEPAEIEVSPGTTVVWRQTGNLKHTVTADDGTFESGDMGSGDTFKYTFEEPGTYPYYCVYHGDKGGVGMSGVVTVTGNGG